MHRLPLTLPDKAAPDSPLVRLCRTLGTHPAAVVLSTMHFKPVPQAYRRDDGDDLTWFIDAGVAKAHDLFGRWELPADSPKSLAHSAPDSPFLAGMCALECFAALHQWARSGQAPGWQRAGKFLRPVPPHAGEGWPMGAIPVKAFAGFTHAAAIVACGFPPWPQLGAHGDLPLVAFPRESTTFPGLFIDDVERVCAQPPDALLQPPRSLPGYPAEEHPFFYALQSVLSLPGFQQAQEMARKQPRIVLRSPNSPASVIATQEALREGNRATQGFRDAVRRHLKKSA